MLADRRLMLSQLRQKQRIRRTMRHGRGVALTNFQVGEKK
jgi:hypothetical protein